MVVTEQDDRNIKEHLEFLLGKDLFIKNEQNACPHCDSKKIIKYGNYKNGQRYKCNICGRTFCNRTFTPFYYSKKNPTIWLKYIELMLEQNTLKICSEKLNIDIGTAFYWRHKILNSLINIREAKKLNNYIEMTKISIKENFKGSRNAPKEEREKIWTIIAADSENKTLARPVCKKVWNYESFNKLIYSKIDENAYLEAYGDRFIWSVGRKHNKDKEIKMDKNNILKDYFKKIAIFMKGYRGVASKYLTNYLYWITLYSVPKEFNSISLLYRILKENNFIKNREIRMNKLSF